MWLIILLGLFITSTNCTLNIPLCPDGGEPVCAKLNYEFIYFENECKLNVYSYKRLFAGKPTPTKVALEECFTNCEGIICPPINQPVCAQQTPEGPMSTVPNACLVNKLICETRQQWIIYGKGPCTSQQNGEYKPGSVLYSNSLPPLPNQNLASGYQTNANRPVIPSEADYAPSEHSKNQVPSAPNTSAYSHTLTAAALASDHYAIKSIASTVPHSAANSYSGQTSSQANGYQSASPASSDHRGNLFPNAYEVSNSQLKQISYGSSKKSSHYVDSPKAAYSPPGSNPLGVSSQSPAPVLQVNQYPTQTSLTPAISQTKPRLYTSPTLSLPTPTLSSSQYLSSAPVYESASPAPKYESNQDSYPSADGYHRELQEYPRHYATDHPLNSRTTPPQYDSQSLQKESYPSQPSYPGSSSGAFAVPHPSEISHGETKLDGYQREVQTAAAYYDPSQPANQSSYATDFSHPVPNPDDYERKVSSIPTHYESSQRLDQGLQQPAESYTTESLYSAQNLDNNQVEPHIAAIQYENSQPSKDYQEKVQSSTDETQSFNHPNDGYSIQPQFVSQSPEPATQAKSVQAPIPVLILTPASTSEQSGYIENAPVPLNIYLRSESVATAPVSTENNLNQGLTSDTYQGNLPPLDQNQKPYSDPVSVSNIPIYSEPETATAPEKSSYNENTERYQVHATEDPVYSAESYSHTDQETLQVSHTYTTTESNSTQAVVSAPTQATYSDDGSYPTPTEYTIQGTPANFNVYLTAMRAKGPNFKIFAIPYRYPLSPGSLLPTVSSPSQELNSASSPALTSKSNVPHPIDLWPQQSLPVDTEIVPEAYEPQLAATVAKWIDSNPYTQNPTPNAERGYSLGVPLYYQPTYTFIQYNGPKHQHSSK